MEEEEDFKPAPQEFFGSPNYPTQPTYKEEIFPPDQPTDLCNEEYPGPLNFEVYIIPNEQKTPWEYSPKLNKIFIGINLKFPVAFSVKTRPNNMKLYVRATPVFSQAQFFQELVHRCIGHQHPQDPTNKGLLPHIFQHIMRCSNEEARYFGDKNEKARLNIVLPLSSPQAGTEIVREFYQFVCKNSCPLGMNRRPIEIIFTLEDQNGQVLGRRIVAVRVCSCPKRDREKEERDAEKSEKASSPQGKKRKLAPAPPSGCDVDAKIYPLNINVLGKHNYLEILRFSRGLMATEILKFEGSSSGGEAPFRKSFDEINALITVFVVITWMFINGAQAQVTFSRDWNPGKRMVENPEFHNTMKTASTICHLLINQVRQLAACENNRGDDLDPGTTTIFSGRR
ncbi:P53 domain containing protein [Asbolus verrucosus]|uniref:P53 domain containing protein n=1 Tax=Asbolus verrucosus TaxID=1661398 RepID=A0A482VJ27_ASBVE|nr:P53 domain containing protein [Asbolus verrucosus]